MFFWRRVAPQIPEDGLKPTATPSYTRNFREINRKISQGKSFSGYERNSLFLNLEGKGFTDVAGLVGANFDDDARAVATVDWDRDGDLDIWVTNRTAPQIRLLKNNQPSTNSYLAIRLRGNNKTTNGDAIGARLTLAGSSRSQPKQIRTVRAGDGFLTQSTAWTHFGLGRATEDLKLTVAWPGGSTETFSGLKPNTHYVITQDQGVVPWRPRPVHAKNRSPSPNKRSDADPGTKGLWIANRLPFPKLTYSDDQGRMHTTTELLGAPVLVNLWATWCAPCLEELTVLSQNKASIRSHGATVLALNVDGLALDGTTAAEQDNATSVLDRIGFDMPHGVARQEGLAKLEVLIDYLSSRRTLSLPASFLIDAEGNCAAVYFDALSWNQLANDLALLRAPATTQLGRISPRSGRWFADPRQIDQAAYLGDLATRFASDGLLEESQRLYQMLKAKGGVTTPQSYYNLAKAAAQQGHTEQAIEYYQTAIRMKPDYGQALTGLGALLLVQNRLEEAQRLFEKALTIDPNHATALVNLAMIDQSRGDFDSALHRLKKVVARNPDFAAAHLNLGSLLAMTKEFHEAIEHLSKAAELDPNRIVAHLNLAAAYMQTNEYGEAETHYRRAQKLNPRLPQPYFSLGVLQARQANHAEAIESYRTAISLGGVNPQAYTHLGLSWLAQGDKQRAIQCFKKALELDPDHQAATRAMNEAVSSPVGE